MSGNRTTPLILSLSKDRPEPSRRIFTSVVGQGGTLMTAQPSNVTKRPARITAPGATLNGDLVIPTGARGVVLFAHGSGSSRFSPRNRYVAELLQAAGLATLLMDLLTPAEEALDAQTGHLRFDIRLLAQRLVAASDWLRDKPETAGLAAGYFGASTGGGAALVAAAQQ